jgi:PAS domain S-box-containing protein
MRFPSRLQPYLIAVAACLGLVAFAALDLRHERKVSIERARSDTADIARLLEAHLHQTLRRGQTLLEQAESLVGQPGASAAPQLAAQLRALLPSDGVQSGVAWLDAQGAVLASSGLSAAPQRHAQSDWFVALRDAAPPAAASSPAPAPPSNAPTVSLGKSVPGDNGHRWLPMGRALRDAQGRFSGAVLSWLDLDSLQPVLNAIDTGKNGFVTVFVRPGWLVATAPANAALFDRDWSGAPLFKEHLPLAAVNTVQQVVVRDGTERVYSYRALGESALVVSVGVSITDALAPWRQRLWLDVLLLALICTALLWAAALLSRDYTRRERAEAARDQARDEAQRSERFLRNITDNLPLRIAYGDTERRYQFSNRAHCERYGLPREQIIGRRREDLGDGPVPALMQQEVQQVLQGHRRRFEVEETVGDELHVVEIQLVPDKSADGRVQGFYSVGSDVTESHRQQKKLSLALAERETLLREVYHRVKNNLQVVQSLLSLKRRSLPDGEARMALDDSARRIRAMALVHERLYQTGTLSAVSLAEYTDELLRYLAEIGGAAERGITLRAEVAPVQASLEVAVPYGLLLSELVSNSLKHGFPPGRQGSVQVSVQHQQGGLWLQVDDDGQGLPLDFELAQQQSMGLQLASNLATQLGGELTAHGPPGAHFRTRLFKLE